VGEDLEERKEMKILGLSATALTRATDYEVMKIERGEIARSFVFYSLL